MASSECRETSSQQQSPLLRLPKELRSLIYTHIFTTSSNWIRLDTACALDAPLFYDCCSPLDDSHAMQVYGLILSCRQIYAETMDRYYYPHSIFYFYNVNAAMRRIVRMPVKDREALTDVRACMSPRSMEEVSDFDEAVRHSMITDATTNKMDLLRVGLKQEGLALKEGVLRTGSPPADLDSLDGEYAEVTELFGRGPSAPRWWGEGGRSNLRRAWSRRTQERRPDLSRYQSVVKHAVGMGERGGRMKAWAEMGEMDI